MREYLLHRLLLLIPTVLGVMLVVFLMMRFSIGGAIVAETVFARPGIGAFGIEAIMKCDDPQALMLGAALFVVTNFFVDLLYAVIDPRMHYSQ
jgi:peptide/nickel transport system permease protein